MTVYSLGQSELEDTADVVKVAVLEALVRDGLIARDSADDWAGRHCVKISKKTLWRTLTKRWSDEVDSGGLMFTVVGWSNTREAK